MLDSKKDQGNDHSTREVMLHEGSATVHVVVMEIVGGCDSPLLLLRRLFIMNETGT